MNQAAFQNLLAKFDVQSKQLVEWPFPANRKDYERAIKHVHKELKRAKLDQLVSLFAFGSKIRMPGVSDLDTGVVLSDDCTPETLLTVEQIVLGDEVKAYFFHRPGLVVSLELVPHLSRLAPLFGEPDLIHGSRLKSRRLPDSESWILRLISVMNYLALTGVMEPIELWSGPTVSVRLALAKFASVRHIKAVFTHFGLPFPKTGDSLIFETQYLAVRLVSDHTETDETVRKRLLSMTADWFVTLSEVIQQASACAELLYDQTGGVLAKPGQLSESRPFAVNWSVEHAAELAVASLRAGVAPVVLIPPSLAASFIYYRQNCSHSMGAHLFGRLFYPEFVKPKDPELQETVRRQLAALEEHVKFLNGRQMPYGLFHPYGTYLSAMAPVNPWALQAGGM